MAGWHDRRGRRSSGPRRIRSRYLCAEVPAERKSCGGANSTRAASTGANLGATRYNTPTAVPTSRRSGIRLLAIDQRKQQSCRL